MNETFSAAPARRWRKRWIILAALALLLGGLWLFQRSRTNDQLAAIRQAGFPVTLEELEAWHPKVPDDENTALKLAEAASLRVSPPPKTKNLPVLGEAELPEPGEPFSPEMKQAIKDHLENNQESLELAHDAVALTKSRYPVDYSGGFNALLPHLAGIKGLSQLLKLEAMLASEEGDSVRAVQAVIAGLHTGHSLAGEPLFISQLVRIACVSIMLSTLEHVLTQHQFSDEHLRLLLVKIQEAEADDRLGLMRGLAGERCLGIQGFTMTPQQIGAVGGAVPGPGGASALTALFWTLMKLTGIRDLDLRFYLQGMKDHLEASQLPFPRHLEQAESVAQKIDQTLARRPFLILSKMLMPALGKSSSKSANVTARLRIAATALAVERYRAANQGRLPNDLNALPASFFADFPAAPSETSAPASIGNSGSAIPTDPFDGKPLRYEKLEKGYRIWGEAHTASQPTVQNRKGPPVRHDFTVLR